jgi:hypothetical protein
METDMVDDLLEADNKDELLTDEALSFLAISDDAQLRYGRMLNTLARRGHAAVQSMAYFLELRAIPKRLRSFVLPADMFPFQEPENTDFEQRILHQLYTNIHDRDYHSAVVSPSQVRSRPIVADDGFLDTTTTTPGSSSTDERISASSTSHSINAQVLRQVNNARLQAQFAALERTPEETSLEYLERVVKPSLARDVNEVTRQHREFQNFWSSLVVPVDPKKNMSPGWKF